MGIIVSCKVTEEEKRILQNTADSREICMNELLRVIIRQYIVRKQPVSESKPEVKEVKPEPTPISETKPKVSPVTKDKPKVPKAKPKVSAVTDVKPKVTKSYEVQRDEEIRYLREKKRLLEELAEAKKAPEPKPIAKAKPPKKSIWDVDISKLS